MSKLFKRFIAYFIDMMVVLLITQSLAGIPHINRQLNNYNKYYNEYLKLYEDYATFKTDLSKYYENEELTTNEYESLIEDNPNYKDVLDKYYQEDKLLKEDYENLNKTIDKDYNSSYKDLYFKIEKNSIYYFIIYLVVVFLYFIIFNKITNGQTLGKKLTRLRIVDNKELDKPVSIWSYLIRALILYQPILYIVRLIGVIFMDVDMYYNAISIVSNIQGFLEVLIILMIGIRLDGRGPHDLLARTRVLLYDKNGNEVIDKLNIMVNEIKKESKEQKTLDEESSK